MRDPSRPPVSPGTEDLTLSPTSPDHALAAPEEQTPPDRLLGERIGPYRIVQKIGHGGMGAVYYAIRDDQEFQSEVAVKVVRRGMDSQLVFERFRTERQILATLEHPNIARLLDGGATDKGEPYFVMEYVRGASLTHYCDRHQLSISERLRLFRKVCDAVSYAHRKLIIHRDLKPDNILVTEDGTPKLLDFGIAKILEFADPESGAATMTAVRLGTPAYASPEQIRGLHVGVATDIYSLGIVLYELLTGRRPYRLDSVNWEESARVICERDATRPSSVISSRSEKLETEQITRSRSTTVQALRKRLTGDLDNILAVALRKEPERRYRSVDEFSEELQRHLDDRPVLARGDSLTYRARKFIGRHTLAVAFTSVFTLLLGAAGAFAVWQAHRLSVRVDEDRKLASSFLADIHDEIARLPGSTPVRQALLAKSVEYLNGLSREKGSDREVRRSLALAYERFAELLAGVNGSGLGKSREALKTYETAKGMREALAAESPQDLQAQGELAANYLTGSFITGRIGSVEQRLVYDRKALALSEKLLGKSPGNPDWQSLYGKACASAAYSYNMAGRYGEAMDYFRRAVPVREQLAAKRPGRGTKRELANIYYRLGVLEAQSEHPRPALDDLGKALEIQEALHAENQDDEQIRSDLAGTHHFLGVSLTALGDTHRALEHFQTAISLHEAAAAADPHDARTRSLLAGNYAEQGTALLRENRKRDALRSIQRAITLQQQLLQTDVQSIPGRMSQADYHSRLGDLCESLADRRCAAESWTEAAAIFNQLAREGHLNAPDVRRDAARARAEADRCSRIMKE
jgi:eukaryotic-like serine/threonine-protein kinase